MLDVSSNLIRSCSLCKMTCELQEKMEKIKEKLVKKMLSHKFRQLKTTKSSFDELV